MRGHLAAQNRLGECYLDGKGVDVDVVQARFWFGMAAHYGNEMASQNIRRLLTETRRAV
jgi:TPR repeat protein